MKKWMEANNRFVEPGEVALVDPGEETMAGEGLRWICDSVGWKPFGMTYGEWGRVSKQEG